MGLGRRRADRLLLGRAGDDVDTVLRDGDKVIADLENLLDQGGVLLLRANQHLLLGGSILAQKRTALTGIVIVIQHDRLVLLDRNARGMLQRLIARNIRLRRADRCQSTSSSRRRCRSRHDF
jgi:hypothetical protein